jgi:hypothetical protein
VIFVGMTLKGYSDSQGDDLTIFLRVNLSKTEHATIKITRGHGNNWEVFTNHQWKTNRNEHASNLGIKTDWIFCWPPTNLSRTVRKKATGLYYQRYPSLDNCRQYSRSMDKHFE